MRDDDQVAMSTHYRPIKVSDFDSIETSDWSSEDQVRELIEKQGIGSMLAFDGNHYLGQLYVREYDPSFTNPGGVTGGPEPWRDFSFAEPLGLRGRYLTLGCYHVGWKAGGTWESVDTTTWGNGVGTGLLKAVVEWLRTRESIDGLLAWALVHGSKEIHQHNGQMPHTVYERSGFNEIKRVNDPSWAPYAKYYESDAEEDPTLFRVMLLER